MIRHMPTKEKRERVGAEGTCQSGCKTRCWRGLEACSYILTGIPLYTVSVNEKEFQ